jgi:hypothetical protein
VVLWVPLGQPPPRLGATGAAATKAGRHQHTFMWRAVHPSPPPCGCPFHAGAHGAKLVQCPRARGMGSEGTRCSCSWRVDRSVGERFGDGTGCPAGEHIILANIHLSSRPTRRPLPLQACLAVGLCMIAPVAPAVAPAQCGGARSCGACRLLLLRVHAVLRAPDGRMAAWASSACTTWAGTSPRHQP